MTDYAEIRGTPADPLFALRTYCRGEQAGLEAAVDGTHRARLLLLALLVLGVPESEAYDLLWDCIELDPFAGIDRALFVVGLELDARGVG